MNILSLVLRILSLAGAIVAGAVFFLTQGKLANKQKDLEIAQKSATVAQTELELLSSEMKELRTAHEQKQVLSADLKQKLEAIRSEMYTAQMEAKRTQEELDEAKKTINEFKTITKDLRAELIQTEQLITNVDKEAEIEQLNRRIADLETSNATLKNLLSKKESKPAQISSSDDRALSTGLGSE